METATQRRFSFVPIFVILATSVHRLRLKAGESLAVGVVLWWALNKIRDLCLPLSLCERLPAAAWVRVDLARWIAMWKMPSMPTCTLKSFLEAVKLVSVFLFHHTICTSYTENIGNLSVTEIRARVMRKLKLVLCFIHLCVDILVSECTSSRYFVMDCLALIEIFIYF